jgi:hypothetical protein
LTKRKTITKQQRKAIRTYVKQSLSANKIQKKLQKQQMGMRRTVLLSQIRKIKQQQPKSNRLKYTPRKYRTAVRGQYGYPSTKRSYPFGSFGKQVSVYGRCSNGVGERYDFHGSGRDLYRAIILAHKIVPKRRFVRVSARDFLANPFRYGERGYWVDREVAS